MPRPLPPRRPAAAIGRRARRPRPAWITAATWRSLRAVVTRLRADALAAVDRDGPTAAAEALGSRSTLDRWRVTWLRAPQDAALGRPGDARVIGQDLHRRGDRGACARMARGWMRRARRDERRPSGEVRRDGACNVVAARKVATLPAPAGVHVRAHHVARRDRVRRELAPAPRARRRQSPTRMPASACAARVTRAPWPAAWRRRRSRRPRGRGRAATARRRRARADLVTDRPHRAQGRGAVGVDDGAGHRPAGRLVEPPARGADGVPQPWR